MGAPRRVNRAKAAERFEIERAIEVFTCAHALGRSYAFPHVAERVEGLWVTRDQPRTNPRDYRREEWFAVAKPPARVDAIARRRTRGRFAICAIRAHREDARPLREAYKALGYRLNATEPIFIHRLDKIPRAASKVAIERVLTQQRADQLAKTAGRRQMLPQHLSGDSGVRQYVALDGSEIVGWVRSITVGAMTWCANMYVLENFRRRGIGKALLSRMLRDDRAAGATANVLAASHAGAMLYPIVGYEQIAELLLYTPVRRQAAASFTPGSQLPVVGYPGACT